MCMDASHERPAEVDDLLLATEHRADGDERANSCAGQPPGQQADFVLRIHQREQAPRPLTLQIPHQPEEGPGMRPAQLDHPHSRRNLGEELACRHPEQEIHPMSLRHEVLRHVHGDALDAAALEGVG